MDKYQITINGANKDYSGNESVELGCVLKNGERFVPLLNKGKYMKNGYSMGITRVGNNYYIHLDSVYKELLYKNFEIIQPMIFHEIGHLENGDFNKEPVPSELRMVMLNIGKVMPQELAADKFAASIVGKKAVKNGLKYLLEIRKNNYSALTNCYTQSLNIKELELRIKNL